MAIRFAQTLPAGLALVAIAGRLLALSAAGVSVAVLLTVLASAGLARRASTPINAAWLNRQLDQLRPEFEDSAELLWSAPDSLPALVRLQRTRIAARLDHAQLPELRTPWPWRRLILIWLASTLVALLAVAVQLPKDRRPEMLSDPGTEGSEAPQVLSLIDMQLDVTPPAYTRLPEYSTHGPEATVLEGATVHWRIALDGQPEGVRLAFHDGSDLALVPEHGLWQGQRRITQPLLYRLHTEGGPPLNKADAGLNRIEVTHDQPPALRVFAPDRTLSLAEPGQRDWTLEAEASDDYGLTDARLSITLAHGTGENVVFRETVHTLRGEGDATRRLYRHRIALAEAGFEPGDDLILRLSVDDNRTPLANTTRHPSLILRWPLARGGEAGSLEGVVRDVMPAYFRSQRQIIIDTEALLTERGRLDEESFVDRSDAIGVDQRILRLRYGQFLGEETEVATPPPASDEQNEDPQSGHSFDDGHDHGDAGPSRAARFGEIANVLAEYGHTHDHTEAATLFDSSTRELLRSALNAMWQAELHLRTGRPDDALPHEYQALDFIKRVQQANRIYLARAGLELPPIDFDRRLGGDLAGVGAHRDPLSAREDALDWLLELWTALEYDEPADLDALERWLGQRPAPLADPLSLLAAMDRLRRDPDCRDCANSLGRLIWPLLPRPPAQVPARAQPDAAGERYLDAIHAQPNGQGGRQ